MINAYVFENLDENKCQQVAISRSVDKRSPEVTVLHWHKYDETCTKTLTHKVAVLGKLIDITEKKEG